MIFLSGFVNILSDEEQQQEAARYQENGWELKDPSTHSVRVIIESKDLDDFCNHLRSLPFDKKTRTWTDRNGEQHTSQTISFYMKGSQIAGNHVKLKAAIKTAQDAGQQRQGSRFATPPPQRQSTPAPQRPPLQQQTAMPAPGLSPRQAYKAPQESIWSGSDSTTYENDEIPF